MAEPAMKRKRRHTKKKPGAVDPAGLGPAGPGPGPAAAGGPVLLRSLGLGGR